MRAVVDTSTLVSLARAGHLGILELSGLTPVVLDVVHAEAVDAGRAGGHADAVAIEAAVAGHELNAVDPTGSVDARVLHAAASVGLLLTNDLALGRRARNLGVRWLRTADLVVLAHRSGQLQAPAARAVIVALRDAGRLTAALADAYVEELS